MQKQIIQSVVTKGYTLEHKGILTDQLKPKTVLETVQSSTRKTLNEIERFITLFKDKHSKTLENVNNSCVTYTIHGDNLEICLCLL